MQVVLLRVGIDTGSGGMHGPLFKDRSFEFLWIPDKYHVEQRTYGNITGRHGRKLIEYFPLSKKPRMENCPVHADPEFETFTYGDPTKPKSGLRRLQPGDFLAFYCGLQGWGWKCDPALYLIGYFHVQFAGLAADFDDQKIMELFANNAHVRHQDLYRKQKDKLVLIKGSNNSRLLRIAIQISEIGYDCNGKPIPVISQRMRAIFGDFKGRVSIMRSPPRFVEPGFAEKAAAFLFECK